MIIFAPTMRRKDTQLAFSRGNFICNKCKEEKSINEFGSHKNSNVYGINSTCKKCCREKDKFSKTRRAYNLSEDSFIKIFESQDGKCDICKTKMNFRGDVNNKYKSACVDHDHETGKVRGLLCSACNRGLGFLEDDINNIYNALKYLEKHGKIRLGDVQE